MKKLTVRQVDEKIYRIIEKLNEYTKKGKQFQQHHAIAYCNDLGLDFMTFYNRIRKNEAFGLQYDKKTKCYSINTDTHPKYYEMQLESGETKRPLTISEIENTEHYKALKAKVEELEAIIEENVDNSYRWNDKCKELLNKINEYKIINDELSKNSQIMHNKLQSKNANLTELLNAEMEKVKSLKKDKKFWFWWLVASYGLVGTLLIYQLFLKGLF